MECIQNSATNDYKLKCSHTTLCLSIDGCSHTYNMYYLGGSQRANSNQMNYQMCRILYGWALQR